MILNVVLQLFSTGDQIYADDVAYPLFVSIRYLCIDIMGYIELLPILYTSIHTGSLTLGRLDTPLMKVIPIRVVHSFSKPA